MMSTVTRALKQSFAVPQKAMASREEGLDAFRALGALGVIQLHFGPFRSSIWTDTSLGAASVLASYLARMAVPFFFITSGYLLARRGAPGDLGPAARAQCRRILSLFVAWSLIALAFRGVLRGMHHRSLSASLEPSRRFLAEFASRPLDTLFRGSEEHLWFLPALASGLGLYAALDIRPWSQPWASRPAHMVFSIFRRPSMPEADRFSHSLWSPSAP